MSSYSGLIAEAIGKDDAALVGLVEDFMRAETGGALDGLGPAEFADLARGCLADILDWQATGEVGGLTLAGYCEASQLVCPVLAA